jgi:O-antigen/teichoic acid export membrane protein
VYKQIKSKSEFVFNLLTTMSGTFLAQIIPILIMPILTRQYSPSDFGIFSIYIALASICSVIAAGRYEIAILLPKNTIAAFNILCLSLTISGCMSLFFLLFIISFHQEIAQLIGNQQIDNWLYLIPVSILFNGVLQSLTFWSIRNKQFSNNSLAKVNQGLATSGLQVALSVKKTAPIGLISGYVIGLLVSTTALFNSIWNKNKSLINHLSIKRMYALCIKYKKFPLYSMWGALLDSAAIQIPIFMISKFYQADMTGLFSLTFRTLNLPIVLIAASISQVLFQKITYLNNYKPELLYKVIFKVFFILLGISLPFLLIIYFFGSDLFSIVFGQQWAESGKYASIIVFAIAIRFSVSPLSSVLIIEHNLKLGFFWQLTYFITISLTLYFAARFTIDTFILVFVIHEIILYLFYFYLILLGSKRYHHVQNTLKACSV